MIGRITGEKVDIITRLNIDLEIYALYSPTPERYPSNRISDEYEKSTKKSESYKQTKISAINQSHGI